MNGISTRNGGPVLPIQEREQRPVERGAHRRVVRRAVDVADRSLPLEVHERKRREQQPSPVARPQQQRRQRSRHERAEPGGVAPDRRRDFVRDDAPERVQEHADAERDLPARQRDEQPDGDQRDRPQRGQRERLAPSLGERVSEQQHRHQRPSHDADSRPRLEARRSSAYAPIAYATPPSAENSAATGLARAVVTASSVATQGRRRCSASIVATAGSSPNANARRPVNRFVAVAAPNQTAASQASGPKCRRTSSSNRAAVPVAAIPATSCGESSAEIGGNSTL